MKIARHPHVASSIAITLAFLAAADLAQAARRGGRARNTSRAPDVCKLDGPNPEMIVDIPDYPSYFAKITPDGKYMCYIAGGKNIVMDLKNPSTRIIFPGPYDPVPVGPTHPGGKWDYITAPNRGMGFYSMTEALAMSTPGRTTSLVGLTPVFNDSSNGENYQSPGVIPGPNPGDKPIIRLLGGSLVIRDYDTSTEPWTIKQSFKPCAEETWGRYQLPMLSKDGQEMSVYDTQTGTTKIIAIRDGKNCEEKLDLGFATGKVEFSYDGSAIAFHVDSFSRTLNGRTFSGVSDSMTKNVYVLDLKRDGDKLEAGTLRKLTSNTRPGSGSYYPSFTLDGKVVYVHGENAPDAKYSFRVIDPHQIPGLDLPMGGIPVETPDCTESDLAARFVLGAIWQKSCAVIADGFSAAEAAQFALSLDPRTCPELVQSRWDNLREEILANTSLTRSGAVTQSEIEKVTLEALSAVCPKDAGSSNAARITHVALNSPFGETGKVYATGRETFEAYCKSCHGGGAARNYEWDQLKLDDVNRMLIAIESGDMPRTLLSNRDAVLKPLIKELMKTRTRLESETP